MLKNSGLINGRASVFVMPAAMPVQMDAMAMSFKDRQSGWAAIAVDMVRDLDCAPVQRGDDDVNDVNAVDFEDRGDGNPYAYADKDVQWQRGF